MEVGGVRVYLSGVFQALTLREASVQMLRLAALCITTLCVASCIRIDHGARVQQLGNNYEIILFSTDLVLLPITAEGPFPKSSEVTRLITTGAPDEEVVDGVTYQKYTIGRNVRVQYERMAAGTLLLSETERRLVVHGDLSHSYSDHTNHSGNYDNVKIEKPEVIALSDDMSLESVIGKYVRAIGRFQNQQSLFVVNNHALYTRGFRWLDEAADYEIIGRVESPRVPSEAIGINIVMYEKVGGASDSSICSEQLKESGSN